MHATCVPVEDAQKRPLDPVELELQVVVSYLIRILGIELRSFSRTVCIFAELDVQPLKWYVLKIISKIE